MKPNLINMIPSIEGEELVYLQSLTNELREDELLSFIAVYNGKRRTTDQILIGCVLGFVCVGGIQRFMIGQNGMGILYLFTGGLCLIGTIVDLVNHKKLAFEYNRKMANESMAMLYANR
ncbi:MAG: TM2 domain-containing protein [Chitinophagaceae bacterium]|jgi:TM2 domain-containing membrane protein YozV|nr:TM2 domain-containing protein [Chitinophagaceae bacterium]MEA3425591.1 TM2 domain-containing protein [Bacteroidota bacterium]MCA6452095.1 TM2 domain-containing protein [Chitinophagaceae bacterium]MCA6457189.1 TM2 domain-containing protein [Chitinophagaceae bacterium]MCA6459899.1 TM2 domain-containing protein [Chitinophagaceae bacterium]